MYEKAGNKHWDIWLQNSAVKLLSEEESAKVEASMRDAGETDRVQVPRWVLTDKNDGVRTAEYPLSVGPSARL
eukprot:4152129-Alexandrium_andersonii.AAC.1